ncbi:hypothetical protein ACF3NR_02775 [Vaginella massiliensis]|uniref:hypothetical protein n=1 Tax=Vaginella massiliensis TaxID=1816680 RepID=UPI0008386475|nr:hypothetical protein [Vaginella massiliensis]
MFKRLLFGLMYLTMTLVFTSCLSDDDGWRNNQVIDYSQNRGEVTYDGLSYPIKFMNIRPSGEVLTDGSRVYQIDLSTNYLNSNNNTIQTDALFQADIIVPRNASITGNYDMLDLNGRTFNFAWYYEGVKISGNQIVEYDFEIRNQDFVSGTLSLKYYNDGYAEVQINAIDGYEGRNRPLNLWFAGYTN